MTTLVRNEKSKGGAIHCSAFIFACGKADTESIEDIKDKEAENDTWVESDAEYWLCGTGIPDGPDYTGGICKVYFKQNVVVLEGRLKNHADALIFQSAI